MTLFHSKVAFTFEGQVSVNAETQVQALQVVIDSFGLVLGGNLHSNDSRIDDWQFSTHPVKIVASSSFDPNASFESVFEAIESAMAQPEPRDALKQIVNANIDLGEFGFASEVIAEFEAYEMGAEVLTPSTPL